MASPVAIQFQNVKQNHIDGATTDTVKSGKTHVEFLKVKPAEDSPVPHVVLPALEQPVVLPQRTVKKPVLEIKENARFPL